MAFYACVLGDRFKKKGTLVVLCNESNWAESGNESAQAIWHAFKQRCIAPSAIECRRAFWQEFPPLLTSSSLGNLKGYLKSHECL